MLPLLILFLGRLHYCFSHNLDEVSLPKSYLLDKSFIASDQSNSEKVVSVADYGAKGDGNDDSQAFQKAWKEVCASSTSATLMVPNSKSYHLKPVTFEGPCKANVKVVVEGAIQASNNIADWGQENPSYWIKFDGVDNLIVQGGGTINGNGKTWWQNSCKRKQSSALTFYSCNKLRVDNLRMIDSQKMHLSFERCTNVNASHISITAPEESPNTDGIHVTQTQNIVITDCVIQTGDDCISIVSGSKNVVARNINCGPGHGISIGSLGEGNSAAQVSGVTVDTAKLTGTTNGVRIKTWQGGRGYARDITFSNVVMQNVKNPIIIDQNYCDSDKPCHQQGSAVEVSGVVYKNIKGTSASKVAIDFECSKSVPCHDILLQDINLVGVDGGSVESSCQNVHWGKTGTVVPFCSNN
ncbi:polygalacturonase-like [Canna indica]|uniref:endo-polygalacturonase n=1 Tax=Canna indica TaxID=4628 RepID=A0AAQ3KAQ1_9LILI|nr:polygalacturonase-like [Canna indica]